MDRYLSGEEIDPKVLIEDLEKAVARGSFYPVLVAVRAAADRHGRAARGDDRGVPLPRRAPAARGHHAGRQAGHRPVLPTPRARCWPRWSRPPPTPTSAGSAWSGCSPARCAPTPPCTCPATGGRPAGTHDHDDDERIGALTSPLGKQQRPVDAVRGRRHLRGGQARHGRDRRHAVGQGPPAADGAVVDARAAAAGRDRGQVQGRRGQAVPGPGPAGGRGPDAAAGEQRRDPPAGAVDAWARRTPTCCSTGWPPARRRGGNSRPAGAAARDDRRQGPGPGPERQADRRARRVRHLPRRGRAAGRLGRLRVRRQDRRRRGAAPVHPVGGEGRPVADGAGRAGRLPDDRRPGHPVRRQGALGGLLRHGLPEGRAAGPEGRRGQGPADAARAGGRGAACWCPTTTSAR